jgi:hypothetical protein
MVGRYENYGVEVAHEALDWMSRVQKTLRLNAPCSCQGVKQLARHIRISLAVRLPQAQSALEPALKKSGDDEPFELLVNLKLLRCQSSTQQMRINGFPRNDYRAFK